MVRKMKKHFGFLLREGFSCSASGGNLEHCVSYRKGALVISATYDLRESMFEVGLVDLHKTGSIPGVPWYVRIEDAKIASVEAISELRAALGRCFQSGEGPKEILALYADFIKDNLERIIASIGDTVKHES